MGKPKLTRDLVRKACELKRKGLSNQDICNALHVTTTAFYGWIQTEKSDGTKLQKTELQLALIDGLKEAETDFKQSLIAKVVKHAGDQWQAAAWMLERKYPQEFGKVDRLQAEVQQKTEAKVQVTHFFDYGEDDQE